MCAKKEFTIAHGFTSARKDQRTFNTSITTNYSFLPANIGELTSGSGKFVKFSGHSTFATFNKTFGNRLEYKLYIENAQSPQIVYTGKDEKKTLGALFRIASGHLIALPLINYDESEFIEVKSQGGKRTEIWNQEGIAFGNNLVKCLLEIDAKLTSGSEKTPTPSWIGQSEFLFQAETRIKTIVANNLAAINKIEKDNERLRLELDELDFFKDLLFEKGKALEVAVIKVLMLLDYKAENYDDGNLEMDQIITSPEGIRYIGECEGKDSKDIDVSKFRQLQDSLNADFAREEVSEKAFGILFGNPERLIHPKDRKLDFTTKCKSGAEREKIALVKTTDLYAIARHLVDNKDNKYKKACRDAIHKQLGKVVSFPKPTTLNK